jgi:hypothetical protein
LIQAEADLQEEIMLRLKAYSELIAIAIPNGFRAFDKGAAIRVRNMKRKGLLTLGAPDLFIGWDGGYAFAELKRPAGRDLFRKYAAGRASQTQLEIAAVFARLRINFGFFDSWASLRAKLIEWGAPVQ